MKSFSYFGKTDTGRLRSNNEDNFILTPIWDDRHLLAVVIDGVGGYEGGEVAAAIAADTIKQFLSNAVPETDSEILKQAVAEANNRIFNERNKDLQRPNMACVLSAAILDAGNNTLSTVHVGDTRIYEFSHGRLVKITHDHSFVGYLEDKGDLTELQAMNHPRRNVIDRLLGEKIHLINDPDFMEVKTTEVESGARFLLCSDGLTDMVTSSEIVSDLVAFHDNDEYAVSSLIERANINGGKDNITVLIISTSNDVDITDTSKTAGVEDVGATDTGKSEERRFHKFALILFAVADTVLLLVLIFEIIRLFLLNHA